MWVHDNISISRDLGLLVCEGDDEERMPWMDVRIPEDRFHYENEDDCFGQSSGGEVLWKEVGDYPG